MKGKRILRKWSYGQFVVAPRFGTGYPRSMSDYTGRSEKLDI